MWGHLDFKEIDFGESKTLINFKEIDFGKSKEACFIYWLLGSTEPYMVNNFFFTHYCFGNVELSLKHLFSKLYCPKVLIGVKNWQLLPR